jgi:hypothetical protein
MTLRAPKNTPRRLKPCVYALLYGTAEAVPFQNSFRAASSSFFQTKCLGDAESRARFTTRNVAARWCAASQHGHDERRANKFAMH